MIYKAFSVTWDNVCVEIFIGKTLYYQCIHCIDICLYHCVINRQWADTESKDVDKY